jgi:hypothetical protein
MRNLIEIVGANSVAPSPYALTIPEFEKLSAKELAFVYFFTDYRSPYAFYEEGERIKVLEKDIGVKTSPKIKGAIDKYTELSETHAIGLLKAARESIQKLKKYFNEVDLTDVDDNGKLLYSAKDLITNLKQIGDVVDGLQNLEELVKKEQAKDSVNRGGVETSKYNS